MSYLVRDVDPDNMQDMEKLAAMFNDFDNAWPGGFTRGVAETASRLSETFKRESKLAVLVVEHEDEFVGFCDLKEQAGNSETSYIPLLGARLSHHGKGVGKMLLREMVRRVAAKGFRQVTLGTWAGNLKAVPLYKKTGFNWVPETNVWMRNFMPSILNSAAGKAFFANRDWYAIHQRDIEVAPDDVTWKGMKVYPYRFRDGDDFLNMTFHAESGGLTALETPEYSVSCIIPTEEGATGETYPIVWEIVPHGEKPLEVVLLAEGEPGLDVHVQERLVVEKPVTITREVKVLPDAKPRGEGEDAHRVRSTLLINGQPVVLETGVKVVRAVVICYTGQGLFPGKEEKIGVELLSRLDREVKGTLSFDPHPGLEIPLPSRTFTLPARMKTMCEFTVTARESGVLPTQLRLDAGTTQGKVPVMFRAYAGTRPIASLDAEYTEQAMLETPDVCVVQQLRGGDVIIVPSGRGGDAMTMNMAQVGPPYPGRSLRPATYPTRIDASPEGARLTAVAASEEMPGLSVERTVSILSGTVVKFEYRVVNTGDTAQATKLRIGGHGHLGGFAVAPTPSGLIREPRRMWGDYPMGEVDVLPEGGRFTENWVAAEEDEWVCGLIWQGDPEIQYRWGVFPSLVYDLGEIPPHSSVSVPDVYELAAAGDWKTVRHWWRELVQPSGVHERHVPETVRVLEVRAEPASPALLTQDEEDVTLAVINRRARVLDGTLKLKGEAYRAEPAEFVLKDVDRDRPFTGTARVTSPKAVGAGFLVAEIETVPVTEDFQVPVIRIGSGSDLRISQPDDKQIVLENGYFTLRFAPAFLGSLYALETDGVNHLATAYPEARPFVWTNPWFGGIHPFTGWWAGDGELIKETFTGGPVERVGERGLRWQGVKVVCQPEHKDRRWFRVEAEYLTLPGSNVVAIVSRYTNKTGARTSHHGGIGVWGKVGGTYANTVLHWEREGERRHRRRGGFGVQGDGRRWAAIQNPETLDALLLLATDRRPFGGVGLMDMAENGPHLGFSSSIDFEPNETREILTWVIHTRDLAQLDAYIKLGRLTRLP